MAIDKLCKMVVYSDGIIDLNSMTKYSPKFIKGDVKRKIGLFWDNIVKYKDFVLQNYKVTLSCC